MAKERKVCPSCDVKFPANFGFCPGCGGKVEGKSVGSDDGALVRTVRKAVADELDSRGIRAKKPVPAGDSGDDDFDEGFG